MDRGGARWSRARVIALAAAGAAVVAVTVFKVPLATVFLVGVALLCPLMMMGMHGHGEPTGRGAGRGDRAGRGSKPGTYDPPL